MKILYLHRSKQYINIKLMMDNKKYATGDHKK